MTLCRERALPREEKRAACDGKRPKSREETPKEGSDSARRYRTATICDRAAQSARVFELFPMQISQVWQNCNRTRGLSLSIYFQSLNSNIPLGAPICPKSSRFRD